MTEYEYSPIWIDQKFTFFVFYIYFSINTLGKTNFNLNRILEEEFLYEPELLMEYQKGYNKWIIQAYRWDEKISIEELMKLREKITGIFFDLHCILDKKSFNNYFEKYFDLLIQDKLNNSRQIFMSGIFFQSDIFEEQTKIKNFPKFSLQLKEFRKILSIDSDRYGLKNIIVDIKDSRFIDMHIIDILLYLYYNWYIEVNMILFNTSINFDINITTKWFTWNQKEKITKNVIIDEWKIIVNKQIWDIECKLSDDWKIQIWKFWANLNGLESNPKNWIIFFFSILRYQEWQDIENYLWIYQKLKIDLKFKKTKTSLWTFKTIRSRFNTFCKDNNIKLRITNDMDIKHL